MSATSADEVVPELRDSGKKSVKGATDSPYSITSRGSMSASKRATIDSFVERLDDVWAKESPLLEEWRRGRQASKSAFDPLYEAVMNLSASIRIYFKFLVTMEAWLLGILSVAATLFFSIYEVKGQRLAVNVSWAFISFAIIFPLTNSLNETFRRREVALTCLGDVKAFLVSYYQAHRDWDWGANGRSRLPAGHLAQVRFIITSLVTDMRDVLTAPSTTRQIHYHTEWGKMQRVRINDMSRSINDRIADHFDRISLAVEELKYAGQPGNESSRMRQYITLTMKAWEKLKYIKRYRTPIATRAFARVYIFVHPIFWGPYYAYLVEQMLNESDSGTNSSAAIPWHVACAYVYACALAVLTSLAMMGLFNVRYRLEDPFCPDADLVKQSGSDQIHITQELAEVMRAVSMEFADADQNPAGGGPSRSCYPLPEGSALAHLEIRPAYDITTICDHI
jgi:hypothetical protein